MRYAIDNPMRVKDMWESPATLSAIGGWSIYIALGAALVAAFVGAAGTIASNRASDLTIAKANERIAVANARAAEAKAEAASAIERAAEANKQAEEAKAEAAKTNERLQKSQEMRRLTNGQANALEPILKSDLFQSAPKTQLRVSSVADAESESFALEIQRFFEICGVNIYPTNGGVPSGHIQHANHPTGLDLHLRNAASSPENQPYLMFLQAAKSEGMDIVVTENPDLREKEAILCVMRKPAS
jgi:hypothetical protein